MGLGGTGQAQRGSGETGWQLPAPMFKRTERKESPWQAQCGPLCGTCALRGLCGKPRLLPAPFPSCSRPSWYPVAIATCFLRSLAGDRGGRMGRPASCWWGGEQQCGWDRMPASHRSAAGPEGQPEAQFLIYSGANS